MTKRPWIYCVDEIDAGYQVRRVKKGRMIELICASKTVTKPEQPLYLRSTFSTRAHRETIADRFRVDVTKHMVKGVRFDKLAGYVLWRDWYEKYPTNFGGYQLRHVNQEVLGAFLNGEVVYRMADNPSLTDGHRAEFSEVFENELTAIEQVLQDAGYDRSEIDY